MRREKKKIILLLLVTLIALLFLPSYNSKKSQPTLESSQSIEEIPTMKEEPIPPPPAEIVIAAVGDIMVHGPQLRAQYDSESNQYDFTNNFQFVKDYLKEADLTIGNLETTFAGEEKGYSSFPMFNTPDALADALKEAGFQIISTANNHTIDTGSKGMFRTVDVLESRGLKVTGTRRDENTDNFIIETINDIKVGLTSYTYETPRFGEYKTLNGIKMPKEIEDHINSFSYEYLDEDLLKIEETIKEMKGQGAEVIVFYVHWGEEYQRQPNRYQRYIAHQLSNYGVDIVFGSHPHVIQPIEFIESEDGEQKTLVVYSLGNFLSNQRYEILKNRYTEDGIIVNVKIEKDFKEDHVSIKEVSYIPTWVYRYYPHGKPIFEIIPVVEALENLDSYHITNQQMLWRMQNSKNNTIELIDSQSMESEAIPIYVEGQSTPK
ncbi:MAG: CapA family protein [Clostridiaceae bacterium]|nr:CapA family protein [Clostridiaceae bacterium]